MQIELWEAPSFENRVNIREDPFELTPPTFGHCYLLNDKGEQFSNSGGDKKRKVKVT